MAYRFACLDVIVDAYCFSDLTADQKLTVSSMPLYAVFERRGKNLSIRYEAVDILLRVPSEELFRVGLSKAVLLEARNEFLRFEAEQELGEREDFSFYDDYFSLLFSGDLDDSEALESLLSSSILATSGGM